LVESVMAQFVRVKKLVKSMLCRYKYPLRVRLRVIIRRAPSGARAWNGRGADQADKF